MSSITQTEATKRSRPRPDYLRVVPEPGPSYGGGTPATPCPTWCTVGKLHEDGDHYHHSGMFTAGPVTVSAEILDDGSPAVMVHPDCSDGDCFTLDEVDELIAALNEVRATLTGTLVAA